MGQPILATARLELVPLSDAHLELEIELDADRQVMRYLDRLRSRTEVTQAHARRLAAARDGLGFWAGLAEGSAVGWWLLRPPNGPDQPEIAGHAELGYRLLPRCWRRGYASEGARELIRYGFAELGLDRIFAQTMAVNVASRATMKAVGMRFARAFVSGATYERPLPGAEFGEVEYALTREMWLRR